MSYIKEENKRGAGVLMHISSLPGHFGIGTFGKSAYEFVDLLAKSNVKYWQILPLVQTGYGDSPYQSVCCSSGNPYFIDPEFLKKDGLLTESEVKEAYLPDGNVDYGTLYNTRYNLLRTAYSRFDCAQKNFRAFVYQGEFDAYAKYMTLKQAFDGKIFSEWDYDFKYADPVLLEDFKRNNLEEYNFWQFVQYEFSIQWHALKNYANSKGIKIIGDIPLYVAYDSSDVWSNPKLFKLDKDLKSIDVAGVPPDYFCEDGQLWGNPLYDWAAHKRGGYRWWIKRIALALKTYDVVRIDHFRGFDRYYDVKAGEPTARNGKWLDGPKMSLFEAAEEQLGELPVIAEDLGLTDDGVKKLLKDSGFPGMKVLLFAFDGDEKNAFLPANIVDENSVCYTGTHDNDTVIGYLKRQTAEEKLLLTKQLRVQAKNTGLHWCRLDTDENICRTFIEMAIASPSMLAIIPIQDILYLDNSARMNTPAVGSGNWSFRLKKLPSENDFAYLKSCIRKFNRV